MPEATETTSLLRFLTCGSVDDGKSTLIGRLLYDSRAILADALRALETSSKKRGLEAVDLSLLTDGLQAEREQGITIDVAYRYFATGRRKYILADAPGHEQYTRNMVTAASTAHLAIILVDARKGLLAQTRRHSAIAHLLGIRHLVVAVNKMDLVDWSEARFGELRAEYEAFAEGLGLRDVKFVPLSALLGDMVVARGERLDWYGGPTLIELLEAAEVEDGEAELPLRFPVQLVSRPRGAGHADYRGYLGRVASGSLRVGDAVRVLPSGQTSRVREIRLGEALLEEARAGQSVALRLSDELDISRGDLIASFEAPPAVASDVEATLCWLSEDALEPGRRYLLRHGSRELRATVRALRGRLDLSSLRDEPAGRLELNDIGAATLRLQQPLAADPYDADRATGAFILVDERSHATVGAGLIRRLP